MPVRTAFRRFLFVSCVALWAATPGVGADSPEVEIDARPVPGQLDMLQGTAIQLGGKPRPDAEAPETYSWAIVEGEGGRLYDADQAAAIFAAPEIDTAVESFVVELTAGFSGGRAARARLFIRVHREAPAEDEEAKDENGVPLWLSNYYSNLEKKKEQENLARTSQLSLLTSAYGSHYYPHWHVGWGWGWGGFVSYPLYVPIVVPPPGAVWGPGDGDWVEPTPIPYDELGNVFPEEIADDYTPGDDPLSDVAVEPGP